MLGAIGAALTAPAPAFAGCAVKFPDAVACFDPESAAQAWRVVRRDPQALAKDYVREVLGRAGCVRFSDVADPDQPILKATASRVASLEGWTPVLFLSVTSRRAGGSAVWIAEAYVEGECEPMPRSQ